MKQTKKQKNRTARKKQGLWRQALLYGVIALIVTAIVMGAVLSVNQPAISSGLMGEEAAIGSALHIPTTQIPGPYSSNPPAGGVHYEPDFEAGFYDESDLASLPQYPEGYLVHNLEHGYVIFWYNCGAAGTDCAALKQTIQDVMAESNRTKLIAFPWTDMDIPLAMTSWGRILEFDAPDTDRMLEFVRRNYNQAPEPNMS